MNRKKVIAFLLSVILVAFSFTACGNSSEPGKKNDDELKKAPDSIELVDETGATVDVTAITAATDQNGKVIDANGIFDKKGHKIYSTGQVDASGLPIYTTGKVDSHNKPLYTKNQLDSFGNLIYYTGVYGSNGKLILTPTDEAPDYTSNDVPKNPIIQGTTTTTTTVGYTQSNKDKDKPITVITDAKGSFMSYFGGKSTDAFNCVSPCKDGGFIAGGFSKSKDGDLSGISSDWDGYHSMVLKYDANGSVKWKYIIGGDADVMISDVTELKDGSVIAIGYTSATDIDAKSNSDYMSGMIVRIDKNGKEMWQYSFPGDVESTGEYISCVSATPDGGFVVGGKATSNSGFFNSTDADTIKAFIFKFDKNCNIKWRKVLTGTMSNNISAIDVNEDGDIFATCVTASTDMDFSGIQYYLKASLNTVLLKLNKKGNLEWAKYLDNTGNSEYNSVVATDDGGCVIGGSFQIYKRADGIYSKTYGGSDGNVIRYNAKGDVCWATPLGGSASDYITGVAQVDGGFAIVGHTRSTDGTFLGQKLGGEEDGFIIYLDDNGKVSTTVLLDGSKSDRAMDVCTLADGSAVVSGFTKSTDNAFEGSGAKNEKAFVGKFVTETTQKTTTTTKKK
ncbi:MAG: aryl-sulfate sulfotransferase [Clostridia bacterium]|nr:aryl-sulfate sulfotransferase [Clostridia bacterium]